MGTHLDRRATKYLLSSTCLLALAGCTHNVAPRESSPAPVTAELASRPTSQYPVFYGVPTVASITDSLNRIHHRLDTASSPQFIDRTTRKEVTDISQPIPNLAIDSGPDRKFGAITYPLGVIHSGMINCTEVTGDPRFAQYTAKWFNFFAANLPTLAAWSKPTPKPPPATQPDAPRPENPFRNFLAPDSLDACGSMTSSMIKARLAGVGPDLKPIIDRAVDYVHARQFRLPDGTLARHRPVLESVWADDMYMGVNILAQAGKMSGDNQYYDDACKQVLLMSKHLFVPTNNLMAHGYNTATDGYHPRYHWARANGWCLMAMAELLTVLPESHPDRPAVLKQFRALAQGIATTQGGDGLWHQMLDRTDSYTETSASAMFTFAIARAVDKGWLDAGTYGPVAVAGWNGVATRIDPQGHVTGTCVGTSYAGDYVYYYYRPSTDDVHGYGPVLLAGSEMTRLLQNPAYRISAGPNNNGNVGFSPRR